jgi:hypothetical protein
VGLQSRDILPRRERGGFVNKMITFAAHGTPGASTAPVTPATSRRDDEPAVQPVRALSSGSQWGMRYHLALAR